MLGVFFGISSIIASPATDNVWFALVHVLEMIFTMTVITVFAYIDTFDCGVCADPITRQATWNPYIKMFIYGGWITMGIDFICYIIMLCLKQFDEEGWWSAIETFMKGIEYKVDKNNIQTSIEMR